MPDYPPEHLLPIVEKLPEDLKEALFSEKTADTIYSICTRNGLEKEKIFGVAKQIGYVLLGLLAPTDLQKTLKEELNLQENLARKISWEVERFIFFPLKNSLEMIYQTEIVTPIQPSQISPLKEKPERDIYREPID